MSSADSKPCACGRIDVHAHFLPECYLHALKKAGLKTLDGGMPIPAWRVETTLEMMGRQNIETAMISLSSPSTHFLPVEEKPRLVREVNDAGSALVRGHPGRFGFFASLPLPDVDSALKEIAYSFDTLGVDGIILESNIAGEYLGSPRFAPIFAELNRRKAVVFLHPTSPACYEAVALGRPAPLLEFPLDTTRTIVDLIYSRTLQTNPDVKLIVPHGGAALPALAARIAAFVNLPVIERRPGSEQEVYETLERLYYDIVLSAHPIPLASLRRLAPIGQLLFGSDWPFTPEFGVARNSALLDASQDLSESDKRAIARENAEKIFPRLRAAARA